MKLTRAIESYLADVSERCEPKTLKSYEGRLKKLRERYGHKRVDDLKEKHVRKWLDIALTRPDGRDYAPDTIRLTVTAWDQLQKHMLALELISEPIFEYGKKPGGRRRNRIPTKAEQAKLFREAIRTGREQFAQIFRCLRLCGARPGELVSADIPNYERDRGLIVLNKHKTAKKTGQPREIGVGRIMARILGRLIGERVEGPIFLDEKQKRWTVEKLSRIYTSLRERLGFSKELVLYCARHEHGTALCKSLGIHAAQHSLGHRDITTTQRYVHPDPAALAGYQDLI